MNEPDHGGDFGSAAIDTFEAVEVGSAFVDLLLEFVGLVHHSHCSVNILIGLCGTGEAPEGLLGILVAALAN